MKKFAICLMLPFLLMATSCEKKKESTVIIAKSSKLAPTSSKPTATGNKHNTQKVEWLGRQYTVETTLTADTTLQLASDGTQRYYDNRAGLRITRPDGSEFFKHQFTKNELKKYIEPSYYTDGALLGMVFLKADGQLLRFVATVGNPDMASDESQTVMVTVDNFGNLRIQKDDSLSAMDEEEPMD